MERTVVYAFRHSKFFVSKYAYPSKEYRSVDYEHNMTT